MKILYIANARIPTEKAHGVHIVKMCEALADTGFEITLILPKRSNTIKADVFSYYGVRRNFSVRFIPVIDMADKGFVGYWLSQISFSLRLLFAGLKDFGGVVLTRDEWSGWLLAKRGCKVFYDMHGFPVSWKWLWKRSMKNMQGIVCTNEWKMQQLFEHFNISKERMLLARNGFDPGEFNIDVSKENARKTLGLSHGHPIVMYSGHLYDWKGPDVLARAAEHLKQAIVVFVGGAKQDVENFTKQHGLSRNILILGQKPHTQIPLYLKAADVLVLPNSKKSKNPRAIPYSIYDTSPIKLFEYMASKRPIVASNLPSIREILDESMAVFFEPDDTNDLAQKISGVLNNPSDAVVRAGNAWEFIQKYTWKNRAELILNFMKSL